VTWKVAKVHEIGNWKWKTGLSCHRNDLDFHFCKFTISQLILSKTGWIVSWWSRFLSFSIARRPRVTRRICLKFRQLCAIGAWGCSGCCAESPSAGSDGVSTQGRIEESSADAGQHSCQVFAAIFPNSAAPSCLVRYLTLSRPPTSSSLRITNCSFRYASPHLWNQLPISFRQPCTKHPVDDVTLSNSPPTCSPVSLLTYLLIRTAVWWIFFTCSLLNCLRSHHPHALHFPPPVSVIPRRPGSVNCHRRLQQKSTAVLHCHSCYCTTFGKSAFFIAETSIWNTSDAGASPGLKMWGGQEAEPLKGSGGGAPAGTRGPDRPHAPPPDYKNSPDPHQPQEHPRAKVGPTPVQPLLRRYIFYRVQFCNIITLH